MSGIRFKIGILFLLLAFVIQIEWSLAAVPYEVTKWMPLPLQNLVIEGLQQNRKLQSIQEEIDELTAEIDFAGSLDDPRIGFGLLNVPTDTFSLNQEPMTQKQIFVAQKFPWFGKLDLKSKRAAVKAIEKRALLAAEQLVIAQQLSDKYFELVFIMSSLDTNRRSTGLVRQLLQVAETRYATGKGLQQDVLQAQVELSRLLDEKITLQKKQRTLENAINGLINRDDFQPVSPDVSALDSLSDGLMGTELESNWHNNPWLKIRQAKVDMAQLEIELARKKYWPDMDVKIAYGQRGEDLTGRDLPNFVSGSVTLNIPMWKNSRQDSRLAAAKSRHQAAVKSYQNLTQTLPFQVDALVVEIKETIENYRLYRDGLLVQADHWAKSSLAAYEVDKVEFNTMLKAQLQLLRFGLQARRYQTAMLQKRVELDVVTGRLLTAVSVIEDTKQMPN
jgi:outer membrane protein TolC